MTSALDQHRSAQFTATWSIEHARDEALRFDQTHDLLGVMAIASLDHDLELGSLRRNVEEHPSVRDLKYVRSVLAEQCRDPAENAGPVVDGDSKIDDTHLALQFPRYDGREKPGIDVPAAQHETHLTSAKTLRVCQNGGQTGRSRALGKRFLMGEKRHHRLFDVRFIHEPHLIDEFPADRDCSLR